MWNIRCRSRWQAPSKCSECLSLSCLERDGSQSERAVIPLFFGCQISNGPGPISEEKLQIPFPERQYVRSFSSVLKLDHGPFEISQLQFSYNPARSHVRRNRHATRIS